MRNSERAAWKSQHSAWVHGDGVALSQTAVSPAADRPRSRKHESAAFARCRHLDETRGIAARDAAEIV
jgi:hypothetical protein